MNEQRRADIGLVVVCILWGLTFPAVRSAVTGGASPMMFVGVRFALAIALLLPFSLRGFARHGTSLIRPSLVLGVLLGGGYAMQTVGMTMTTAARSGFITGTTVVVVPILDTLIRRVPLARATMAGAIVATVGLYCLGGFEDVTAPPEQRAGDLWTLASAISYGVYLILLQANLAQFEHRPLLIGQLAVVSGGAFLLAPFVETPHLALNPTVLGAIAFCAVFATIVTGLMQFRYQGRTSPARVALIFASEPLFAALFAYLLLAEDPGPGALLGGALIVAGVIISDVAPKLLPKA